MAIILTPALVGTPGAAVASADSVVNPTTLTPPTPLGYAVGDTLLCFTSCRNPVPTVATPSGWTKLLDVAGVNGRLVLFACAVVTGTETISVVWSGLATGTTGDPVQARVAAFRNLDNANLATMVDVVGTVADGAASATSSAGGGAITTVSDQDLVLSLTTRWDDVFTTFTGGGTSVTPAFGTTSGADMAMGWGYAVKTPAGSVSASTFALTGAVSVASSGAQIALKAKVYVPTSYSDLILNTPNLISYWRLDEGSGNALDSKNANHGVVAGGITRQVAGLLAGDADTAMRGDGVVGSYINVPYNANMESGAFSIECWVKPTAVVASRKIVSRFVPSQWILGISSASAYYWQIQDNTSQSIYVLTTAAPYLPVAGRRDHLVATYQAGAMKLYINGVAVPNAPNQTPQYPIVSGTSPLGMFAESVGANAFNGVIDDVSIYSGVLTQAQVTERYNWGATVVSSDTPTGSISLAGSSSDSWRITSASHSPAGSLPITGSSVDSYSGHTIRSDFPTATLVLSGSVVRTGGFGALWGFAVRELPPLRHHVDAIAPSGRHYRWGMDERDPQNVPNGMRWGSTMPGGYETFDCVLPRRPGVDYADLERLSTLRVINAGGGVVGEYRLERTPQTSGDQMAISPSAVGWQAHLEDNKNVNIVFIDRDLGGWIAANSQRRLAELTGLNDPVDAASTPGDDGLPSLKLGLQGAWARRANCEAYYFASSGDAITKVKFDYQAAASVSIADGNWVADMYASGADGYSAFTQLTPNDWLTAVAGSVSGDASALAYASRRALMLRLYYATGPSGSDNTAYDVFLRNLRVFGNHNLTVRGLGAGKEGFFASDIISFALRAWCPLLKVAGVTPPPTESVVPIPQFSDWIQPTSFVIPQSKFTDTTVGSIVKESTRFGLEDWAVWNDKIFYLSPRNGNPIARKWRARIGPAKLEETGKQLDRLWESVIVQFNDVDGSPKTVGPPGSGADVESAYLKDPDPDNPANKLGITRRDKLVMGVSTSEGAIEVGRRFLEEQARIDRSGRATLVGHVEDDHGVLHAFSDVQAGDLITFVDAADAAYRRIVRADHDNASRSVSVDLDAPPEGLQAVLERLAVVLVPLGL